MIFVAENTSPEKSTAEVQKADYATGRAMAFYIVISFTAFMLWHHWQNRRGWIWPVILIWLETIA